jgi:hypothetical protein
LHGQWRLPSMSIGTNTSTVRRVKEGQEAGMTRDFYELCTATLWRLTPPSLFLPFTVICSCSVTIIVIVSLHPTAELKWKLLSTTKSTTLPS